MDEETESKTRIRNAEKDLLANIKQNPHKWSSNSLKFKITTETSSTPSVGVEILKKSQYSENSGESVMSNLSNQNLQNEKSSDHKFTGPFHSDDFGWKTLGKIMIYKNFKLSLENEIISWTIFISLDWRLVWFRNKKGRQWNR